LHNYGRRCSDKCFIAFQRSHFIDTFSAQPLRGCANAVQWLPFALAAFPVRKCLSLTHTLACEPIRVAAPVHRVPLLLLMTVAITTVFVSAGAIARSAGAPGVGGDPGGDKQGVPQAGALLPSRQSQRYVRRGSSARRTGLRDPAAGKGVPRQG